MAKKKVKKVRSSSQSQLGDTNALTLLIGGLILVALGAFLGYMYFASHSTTQQIAIQTEKITPPVTSSPVSTQDNEWKIYKTDNFAISYPGSWFVYQASDSCALVSDIENPLDIPLKVSPTGHQLVNICYSTLAMPQSFPYTNGSAQNATIKTYKVSNYTGIRGQQTSAIGTSDVVYLDNPGWGHIEIILETGNKQLFNKMLSTFRFNNTFSDGGGK